MSGQAERRADLERQRQLEAFEHAPTFSTHVWRFRGTTTRICDFFAPDLTLSMPALKRSGFSEQEEHGGIRTLLNRKGDAMRSKLERICESRDPLLNDAKDWKFLLLLNDSATRAEILSITYNSGAIDEDLGVALAPLQGLLVPVGFALAGSEGSPSDYDWPEKLLVAWETASGPASREIVVREPDASTIGYTLDTDADAPVFYQPPPVHKR